MHLILTPDNHLPTTHSQLNRKTISPIMNTLFFNCPDCPYCPTPTSIHSQSINFSHITHPPSLPPTHNS